MSSTNSKPNQMLYAILNNQKKFDLIALIRENLNKTALIPSGKPFTILIPTDSAINKLSMEPKSKLKYLIKSHIILSNVESFKGKDSKYKTATGNFDVKFSHNSNGKIIMMDTNGNEFAISPVAKTGTIKATNTEFSLYRITSGCINPKIKKASKSGKVSKKIHGGLDQHLNFTRCKIHDMVLGKFKSYLRNPNDCINPYAPSVAGLLRMLEEGDHADLCKKVSLLMTHCSFALFYILLQPFKTQGDFVLPDSVIEKWMGMEYYPADICAYFCDFAKKYSPEIYKNEGELLDKINVLRADFQPNKPYKDWIMECYDNIDYPGKNLLTTHEKYYFDELKFKLCNIYCSIVKNAGDFEEVLLYNIRLIELLFPCNDEMSESKFMDQSYQELLRREDLLAPGSIYKFVYSTDFLSLFVNPDIVKSYDSMTSDGSEINLDSKKIFNAEAGRMEIMSKDIPKIKAIHEYNKRIYC